MDFHQRLHFISNARYKSRAVLKMFLGTADRRVAHLIFMAVDGRQTPLAGQFELLARLLPEAPPR